MTQAEVQVEGWWKGEIIWLLSQLKKQGAVKSWDRECRTGNGREKMDFKVELVPTTAAVEVKTALCRAQRGISYNLQWYAADPKRFFPPDIRKLAVVQAPNRYLLVFAYPAPSNSDWQTMLSELKRNAAGICITLARVDDSPTGELSIGWVGLEPASLAQPQV